ncbi:MAG TPA: NAD(P)-dependent oxidoreductase [Thermoleophilaceae bacterium]|nr:NAD(P)-dependent oxidoreductase [Thermoleophilaceae bacterium]
MSPGQPTVAVLGTGIMGGPMAKNVAGAGLDTRVWNRTREKAEGLGLPVAGSPAEAVDGADIVLTMLAEGGAVESVMTEGGALDAMGDDAVWLQASTVGIAATERLSTLAEKRGIAYVDAPVLGTKAPAEKGELTILASGPDAALDICEPVFDAIGAKTVRLGEAGAGTRLKLVTNTWLLSLLGDLAESVAFAERLGVEPERFLEAIDGPTGSPYAQMKGPMMIKRDFSTSFPLKLALKDLELVLDAADRHDARMPVAAATAESFRRAIDQGHGDEDMSAVFLASAD